MHIGGHTEFGTIERILLKRPQEGFVSQVKLASQWEVEGYAACPDYDRACLEYDAFLKLLAKVILHTDVLPADETVGIDSIYVRDAVVMTDQGAILCNMGKAGRRAEPQTVGRHLQTLGIPLLGSITGEGQLEGGDLIWLPPNTLVVGEGYRTNAEGIRQLKALTAPFVDHVVTVPLPHWQGPGDVLHLMSLISPIDHDLAVVYSRLLPIPFRKWLLAGGLRLIEVPDSEYDSMGCNILAIAPRECVMLAGNPITRALLLDAGATVHEYVGEEISKKGAGGPTCLTRPLLRRN